MRKSRYLCVNILMLHWLFPESLDKLTKRRPEIKNRDDLKDELATELVNGVAFASDEYLRQLNSFIENSDIDGYLKVALAIRGDLFGKKSSLSAVDLSSLHS